jgi:hypothetical protein
MNFVDLTGRQFERLTVLGLGYIRWLCRCLCGRETMVRTARLNNGESRSCGCLKLDLLHARATTRDISGTQVYRCWRNMRQRCTNPQRSEYVHYGARGITVCERWESFENFYADMGDPPSGMTLERIDNEGPYSPENCRWATRAEQSRNTRVTRMLTLHGETRPLVEWAERLGVRKGLIHNRLRSGWSVERALTIVPHRAYLDRRELLTTKRDGAR